MKEHQFHAICHKLDKIIRLLEKLQPEVLPSVKPTHQIVSDPGFIPDPNWPSSTWAPNVNSTPVESDR
jgi:hypothetical protein